MSPAERTMAGPSNRGFVKSGVARLEELISALSKPWPTPGQHSFGYLPHPPIKLVRQSEAVPTGPISRHPHSPSLRLIVRRSGSPVGDNGPWNFISFDFYPDLARAKKNQLLARLPTTTICLRFQIKITRLSRFLQPQTAPTGPIFPKRRDDPPL